MAELHWNGEAVEAIITHAAFHGIVLGGEYLLTESTQLVPLEEGVLQQSGTVTSDESELAAVVSYDTVYARRQHEELTWRHDPGRQAKYLEQPAMEKRETIFRVIEHAAAEEIP